MCSEMAFQLSHPPQADIVSPQGRHQSTRMRNMRHMFDGPLPTALDKSVIFSSSSKATLKPPAAKQAGARQPGQQQRRQACPSRAASATVATEQVPSMLASAQGARPPAPAAGNQERLARPGTAPGGSRAGHACGARPHTDRDRAAKDDTSSNSGGSAVTVPEVAESSNWEWLMCDERVRAAKDLKSERLHPDHTVGNTQQAAGALGTTPPAPAMLAIPEDGDADGAPVAMSPSGISPSTHSRVRVAKPGLSPSGFAGRQYAGVRSLCSMFETTRISQVAPLPASKVKSRVREIEGHRPSPYKRAGRNAL